MTTDDARDPAAPTGRAVDWPALLLAGITWLALTTVLALVLLIGSSRVIELAGHETVLRPTLDSRATLHTGPLLPDLRVDSGHLLGVDLFLGTSDATSSAQLVDRYAALAAQPDGQIQVVDRGMRELVLSAVLRAAALASLPFAVWLLLGRRRRTELGSRWRRPSGLLGITGGVLLVLMIWQPWREQVPGDRGAEEWQTLPGFLGDDVVVPGALEQVEIRVDFPTEETRRLVTSAVSTFEASDELYAAAAEDAADLAVRRPGPDEEVALLVSDRHDNVGMDKVGSAIAAAAGATYVLNAGDDTSTGNQWEAFSLDSVTAAYDDLERIGISGNHDHGDFVSDYLADLGWSMLDLDARRAGPTGGVILGRDDPRASGLGAWRTESGETFDEAEQAIAEAACTGDRVNTLLVHDANLGTTALERGCVDLVVGGHLHVRTGPTAVVGDNGRIGYTYTNGTSGGAAYAIALGKTRREATLTLITYRDLRPVGIQSVTMQTDGRLDVSDYQELIYDRSDLLVHPELTESPTVTETPPEGDAPAP